MMRIMRRTTKKNLRLANPNKKKQKKNALSQNNFSQDISQDEGKRKKLDSQERDKLVSDLMRYVLFLDHNKTPIKREDINKNVLNEHKYLTSSLIKIAQKKFKYIFGYDFVEVPNKLSSKRKEQTSGVYILRNALANEISINENANDGNNNNNISMKRNEIIPWNPREKSEMNLLMVILAIISLSNDVIESDTLWEYLDRLGLKRDQRHPTFDEWEKLVEQKFVKEQYLDRKKVTNSTQNETSIEYRMGPRTLMEIGKKNIITWISKIFGEEPDVHVLMELDENNVNQKAEISIQRDLDSQLSQSSRQDISGTSQLTNTSTTHTRVSRKRHHT